MGNFIRSVNWHRWFNPVNRKRALVLAKRTEKRVERNPETYPAEFYRFWSDLDNLRRKDVLEQLRSCCGCAICQLSCDLKSKG